MSDDRDNLRELGDGPSKPEALLIYRRRIGASQEDAARQRGVSMRKYTGWEYGTRTDDCPDVRRRILPLTDAEVCFLYRRRSKMSVNALARDLGCTAYWVTRIERGREPSSVGTLLEYWEQ